MTAMVLLTRFLAVLVVVIGVQPPEVAQAAQTATQAMITEQISQLAPISADSSTQAVLAWLSQAQSIMEELAMGGIAALPEEADDILATINSTVVSDLTRIDAAHTKVLASVVDMLPSMWTTGFWYRSSKGSLWLPKFSHVFTVCADASKTASDDTHARLVNQTSLMVRFTKDNVFQSGSDDGEPVSELNAAYLAALPTLVASVSTRKGFQLSEHQLRQYMETIPSKTDDMDLSVPYPVYVDTAQYKDSDVVALRTFLSSEDTDHALPTSSGSAEEASAGSEGIPPSLSGATTTHNHAHVLRWAISLSGFVISLVA